MAKLNKDMNRIYELGDINQFLVLGGELIYQGAAIGLEVDSGYVRSLQIGDKFLGFAEEFIDATNLLDGQKSIRVKVRGNVLLEINNISLTDYGKAVYAKNDNDFVLTKENKEVLIGKLARYESNGIGLVYFDSIFSQ